jgi:hypothetical protein
MKPEPKIRLVGHRPSMRQDPLAESRRKAAALEAKLRKDRQTMWRALLIGGFAVAAVFAGLEALRPAPPEPPAVEALAVKDPTLAIQNPPPPQVEPAAPLVAQDETMAEDPFPVTEIEVAATREESPDGASELDGEAPLVLTGMDATRDAAANRDKELLGKAIASGEWDAYRGLLARSVQASVANLANGQGLNRFDPIWNEPYLYRALLRWKTLGSFSETEIRKLVTDQYTAAFLLWLLDRNPAMEELLLVMNPDDDSGSVLKFLMDTWSANQDQFEKYFPLALACAVVFDRPMSIPHPIGSTEYGAEASVDPLKRYQWYVEKNEKGKLAAPVHRSNARDLVWVVSAPVTTSELDWAISRLSGHRKNWGNKYGEIEYLMERAVEGVNPYEEYSFAEILKHGGICGDQSYFCVNTARAQGIPAMILAGETDLGGHAWAAIKIDDREWTTGVGRIGGVSKGQAHNPQTGRSITEQDILQWNDRQQQSPAITLNVWRHLWLADFFSATGQDELNAETIRLANRVGPAFTESWQALYSLLEREMELTGDPAEPCNLDDWKAFAKDMRREFKDNPRMAELAANAEMEYIFPYGEAGDATRTLLRERRRIERDSGEQADLIAGSLKREADLIHKRGGPDVKRDIGRLYDRALRDYGGSITGFKTMAEDYFGFMRDDPESARKAARDVELAFKRVVETGTKDWFRANTESSIYRMICGYYRTAGDNSRADLLEKRYEVLLRRSKRSAL